QDDQQEQLHTGPQERRLRLQGYAEQKQDENGRRHKQAARDKISVKAYPRPKHRGRGTSLPVGVKRDQLIERLSQHGILSESSTDLVGAASPKLAIQEGR